MRKQILIITSVASAILLTAMMQDVLAQESLLNDSINQSGKWSFSFNKGDKLTGVLSCTAGTLDLLIWLNDGTAMHRQRAWEGRSVPFSWVIPSTGNWTVEVFDAQVGTCLGWIKLDVERATEGFGFLSDPAGRTVLLGIIAVTVAAIIGVVGYALFQKLKKPRKSSAARNFDPKQPQTHSLLRACARRLILFWGGCCRQLCILTCTTLNNVYNGKRLESTLTRRCPKKA